MTLTIVTDQGTIRLHGSQLDDTGVCVDILMALGNDVKVYSAAVSCQHHSESFVVFDDGWFANCTI